DQPGRYRMLETLRWFGGGHLLEAGEDQVVRRRHAAYYGELAQRAAERRAREGHAPWLQRLDAEHDNLRAALAWSVAQDPARALGDRAGAQSAIEKAVAAASELGDEPRVANALFQLGLLAYFGADREAAAEHVRHSLEIRRRQGDRVGTAFALGLLSSLAID